MLMVVDRDRPLFKHNFFLSSEVAVRWLKRKNETVVWIVDGCVHQLRFVKRKQQNPALFYRKFWSNYYSYFSFDSKCVLRSVELAVSHKLHSICRECVCLSCW